MRAPAPPSRPPRSSRAACEARDAGRTSAQPAPEAAPSRRDAPRREVQLAASALPSRRRGAPPTQALLWLAASLVACEPNSRPPEAPTPPAVAAAAKIEDGPTPRARTRAAVRSCPASGKATPADLDPRILLGEVAGVTWLFGYAAEGAVLAHLGKSGELSRIKVPLHNAQAGAIDGGKIWLYAPRESDAVPTRWTAVDVTDPDAPITGPIESLKLGAKLDHADSLAVGAQRALVIVGVPDERELVLLDTATRAAVAPPHAPGKGFEPLRSVCDRDRCAVIAVADEGGGPERRLVTIRVRADGTRETEQLAPGWIGQPLAADHGDSIIVAWPDHGGVSLRALDRWGRTRGPAVAVPRDSSSAEREALLHADGAVMLAVGGRGRWSVASVGPDAALGAFRTIADTPLGFLLGAPLDDGLVWVNVGGDVNYEELGNSGAWTHFWHMAVTAGFLPAGADPPSRRDITSGGGDGRGGYDPYVLVRPGAAAVLVVPRGDALNMGEPTTMTPLRAPCR